MKENFGKVAATFFLAVGVCVITLHHFYKKAKKSRLEVLRPSTDTLKNIKDERLISNLF